MRRPDVVYVEPEDSADLLDEVVTTQAARVNFCLNVGVAHTTMRFGRIGLRPFAGTYMHGKSSSRVICVLTFPFDTFRFRKHQNGGLTLPWNHVVVPSIRKPRSPNFDRIWYIKPA